MPGLIDAHTHLMVVDNFENAIYKDDQGYIGAGINIGTPNDESFPGATRTQYTAELFYRWQADAHLQITPSLQLIYHPALDPSVDSLLLPGIRIRAAF